MHSIADLTDSGTRRPAEALFSQAGACFQPLIIIPRRIRASGPAGMPKSD